MKKKLLIVITDVLSVCIAYGLALLLRFDMRYSAVPSEYIRGYLFYIILASVILVSSYTIAKLYRSVWTYAGIPEVLRTFVTSGIAAAITGVTYTISVIRMPISFYLVGWGLVFALTASSRMMYRLLRRARIKAEGVKANPVRQNIMIIGAGAAGLMLLKEYRTSYYLTDKVKIFIDDNEKKWNKYLDGVRIAGGRDQILASVDKYNIDKIILERGGVYKTELKERVREIAIGYVTELLGRFRELGIDFNTTQTIFLGGGSILMAEFIQIVWKRYGGEYSVINDTKANAKGYRLQYQVEKKEERK